MTQSDLDRAVAAVTGESIHTISHRGFVLLAIIPIEREPQVVDWDDVEAERLGLFPPSNQN